MQSFLQSCSDWTASALKKVTVQWVDMPAGDFYGRIKHKVLFEH